jgi:hypothetical protein
VEPPADVMAGQAIYSRATLAAYDVGVLGLSCRLLWRCPKAGNACRLRPQHRVRHLDLGVGTAYFLDRCRFPDARPQVTLVDLNPTVLKVAARPDLAIPATDNPGQRAAATAGASRGVRLGRPEPPVAACPVTGPTGRYSPTPPPPCAQVAAYSAARSWRTALRRPRQRDLDAAVQLPRHLPQHR